jgi:uncharacterized protein (TIGR02996 family)
MTQEEAFLQAICESPGDDVPRLVYADWLEEHGGPEGAARAEFIRVQVERARLPAGDPRQEVLQVRQGQLSAAHGAAWRAQLPRLPGINWQRFWRGFVSGADVGAWKHYRRHAAALFAATPVQFLRLFGLNAQQCRELVTSPYLSRLLSLTVPCTVGDAGLQVLAACPRLTGLQVLALVGPLAGCFRPQFSWIGDAGVHALAASPHLSG